MLILWVFTVFLPVFSLAQENNSTTVDGDCQYLQLDILSLLNLIFLFGLMVSLGITIDINVFKEYFHSPKGIFIGIFSQFLIMPLLAYAVSRLLNLETVYAAGLVIVLSCPGGALSNVICFIFQADVALSVAMTIASSAIAIGMMPFNVYIYCVLTGLTKNICFDMLGIVLSTAIVVSGTILGMYLSRNVTLKVLNIIARVGALCGFIILLMGGIGNAQSSEPMWKTRRINWLATFLPVFFGSFLGFGFSLLFRLPYPSAVAIAIETSFQNKLVAVSVVYMMFQGSIRDRVVVMPICYAIVSLSFNTIFGFASWKFGMTNLPKDATCKQFHEAYKAAINDAHNSNASQKKNQKNQTTMTQLSL